MTITFPRDMPSPHRIGRSDVKPMYQQTQAPLRGGQVQAAELGPPLWRGSWQTVTLSEEQGLIWSAWLESLRGAVRTFKARDTTRDYALRYPNGYAGLTVGGNPWDGTGIIEDVGEQLDTLDISGLPAGFIVSVGDLCSYGYASGRQVMHRVMEGATADGSGDITLTVEPIVKPAPDENAVVSFLRPWFKATLDPNSIRKTWDERRLLTGLAFEAIQTLG